MELSDVKHTVRLVTHTSMACPFCTVFQDGEKIDENINHLIQVHDGLLIHVGGETSENYKGEMCQGTSAVLGFSNSPAPKFAKPFSVTMTPSE